MYAGSCILFIRTDGMECPFSVGFPGGTDCKRICLRRRQWHPTPVLLPGKSHGQRSLVGCSPWGCSFTLHFHVLEKEMATHSSVLAWRIPGMGEPDGLPSVGSHRVGHNWRDTAAAVATYHVLVVSGIIPEIKAVGLRLSAQWFSKHVLLPWCLLLLFFKLMRSDYF